MSLSTGHHARASTTIDLGAVVEFSRFSFDQFEIRDTDTDSVNPTATQLYGKLPTHLSVFWRAGHSDLLLFGRKLCSILMLYNAIFTTFYLGFFYPLAGDKTKKWSDNLLEVFVFDMVAEFAFVIFELLFPLRTSIVEIQEGREYVEPADIRRILFRKTAYWANWLTLLGNLLWVDAMSQSGKRTACSWFGLLRLLRYETVRRDRAAASQGGVVISPYRQGVWAGAELVFMMFLLVHLFAVAWFYVLYDTDQETTYEADVKHISVWKFYILALRDAVLLFSASPPTSMTDRDDSSVVLCITMLRPIGAFAEAVIFARIVLIEQRMMILKSKTLEQQAAINAAMTQIKLPPNLHKRINMYHQFLEVQHDKQACDLLYNTSSKALVLEIKICLFASLIEKAPFFRDLHPAGVAEILDNFAEEVFSPGDYIIRFGQEGFEMYFILRGLCDVVVIRRNSMPGPNGIPTARNKLVVAQKREGDYFGETALVQKGQKRTAYVRAQTYTVAEKLTADALNNIVKKKYPDAYNQIVYRISQFHQIAPTPEPEVLNTMHQQQLGLGLPQRGPGAGQPGGVGGGPLAGGSATMLDGVMEHGGGDNLGSTVLDNSASFMVQSEPLRRSTRDAEDAMIRASLATARGGPLQSMALRHSVDPFAAPALASQGIRTTVNTTVGGGPLGGVSSSASNVNFPAIPASVSHQSATLGGGMVPSGRSSTGTSVAGSTFDDGGAGVVGGMISSAGTVVHSATPAHLLVNSNSALQQGQGTLSSSSSSSSAPFAQAAASGSGSGASASSAQPLPPASSLVGGSDAHQPRSGSFAGPLRPSSSFVGSAASAAGLVVASSSSSAAGTATASGDRGTTPAGGPSSPPPHEQIVLQNLLSESHIRGSSDLYSTSDFLRHQQMQSSQEQQEQMQFSGSSRSFTGAVDGVTRVSEKIGLQLKKVLSSASGRNRSPNSTTEDGAGGNGVVPTAGGGAVMSGAIGSLGPGPGG
ncbi:unnamed protein product [Amoebophrya sp. A120]|nr:unnamed protein product [Amoebophrya sp. A120]|eukprot:GSA120T00016687001.1